MIKSDKYYKREEERNKIKQKKEEKKVSFGAKGNTLNPEEGSIKIEQKTTGSFSVSVETNLGKRKIDLDK